MASDSYTRLAFYKPTNEPVTIGKVEGDTWHVMTFNYDEISCDREDLIMDELELKAAIGTTQNIIDNLKWILDRLTRSH